MADPGNSDAGAPQNISSLASLIVIHNRRVIALPPYAVIDLGRRDEGKGILPDIDFTPDAAMRHGVSRRHARIHQSEEKLCIEDLGSTNGTVLNGLRISPAEVHPLEHGDMLQLGRLRMAVSFH
jgi:pSer/pThr/pTyr-binding forkhead associated (FHA) protein